MGKPVSIDMSSHEFVLRGFPDERDYQVKPSDIELELWRRLIEDELLRLAPFLRDLHGFLPYHDLLKKLEVRVGPIRSVGGVAHEGGRLMTSHDGSHIVLTRGCTWLECYMRDGAGSGDIQIDDHEGDLMALLQRHDYRLANKLLVSLSSMLEDSIADKQSRLDKLIRFRDTSNFGKSLNRIGGWRRI